MVSTVHPYTILECKLLITHSHCQWLKIPWWLFHSSTGVGGRRSVGLKTEQKEGEFLHLLCHGKDREVYFGFSVEEWKLLVALLPLSSSWQRCNIVMNTWMLQNLQVMSVGQWKNSCLVWMNAFVFKIHTSQLFLRRAHYILTMPQMPANLPIRTSLAHATVPFKSSSYERPYFKKEKTSQAP